MSLVSSIASVISSAMLAALASAQGAAPAPTTPPAAAPAPAPSPAPSNDTVPDRAWVLMETSKGPVVIELDGVKAPLSVGNFLGYVNDGFYDGTIFHRVIPTFMIQGGGFDSTGVQKETKPPIKNEYRNGLKNTQGTIAMARTSNPDSATAQFFINVVDNPALDGSPNSPGYAVFGKVVGGMNAVEAIRGVPVATRTLTARTPRGTQPMPAQNVPIEIVEIKSVKQISEDEAKKAIEAANAAPAPAPSAPAAPSPKDAGGTGNAAPPKAPAAR